MSKMRNRRNRVSRATRIMASGQKYASRSFHLSNDVAGCRCTEVAFLPKYQLLHAVGSTNLCSQLHNLWVVEPAIATNDEE